MTLRKLVARSERSSQVKVLKCGSGAWVRLPKKILAKAGIKKGAVVSIAVIPSGGIYVKAWKASRKQTAAKLLKGSRRAKVGETDEGQAGGARKIGMRKGAPLPNAGLLLGSLVLVEAVGVITLFRVLRVPPLSRRV